jgi:hypothetical protein
LEGGGNHLAKGTNAMTYATVPSADSEWYFVTDGTWVEGGDMSESTARAIAARLNEQSAEIERLRAFVRDRVADRSVMLTRQSGYHARRICLEAEKILQGDRP